MLGLGKIFGKGSTEAIGGTAEKLVNSIGTVVDGLTTSDEEKLQLKNTLTKTVLGSFEKLAESQRDIIVSETSGNKLQRNWRPILALSFGFIVVSTYFLLPLLNLWVQSEDLNYLIKDLKGNDNFWYLMELMIGGYVISRGVEKVTDKVTQNIDMSFIKKKDRNK